MAHFDRKLAAVSAKWNLKAKTAGIEKHRDEGKPDWMVHTNSRKLTRQERNNRKADAVITPYAGLTTKPQEERNS